MGDENKILSKLEKYRQEYESRKAEITRISGGLRELEIRIDELNSLLSESPPKAPQPQYGPGIIINGAEFSNKPLFEIMQILLTRTGREMTLEELSDGAVTGGYEGSGGDRQKMQANMSSMISRDERENSSNKTFERVGRGLVDLAARRR